MSAALLLPTPSTEPDPPRAGADTPTRLGRVLSLVRKLIDYGKQLAVTVQQRVGTPGSPTSPGPSAQPTSPSS
jgi:hypothetical protein